MGVSRRKFGGWSRDLVVRGAVYFPGTGSNARRRSISLNWIAKTASKLEIDFLEQVKSETPL
jgi:hypothetical protein